MDNIKQILRMHGYTVSNIGSIKLCLVEKEKSSMTMAKFYLDSLLRSNEAIVQYSLEGIDCIYVVNKESGFSVLESTDATVKFLYTSGKNLLSDKSEEELLIYLKLTGEIE